MSTIKDSGSPSVKLAVNTLKFFMSEEISNKNERYAFGVIFDHNIKEFFESVSIDFTAALVDMHNMHTDE